MRADLEEAETKRFLLWSADGKFLFLKSRQKTFSDVFEAATRKRFLHRNIVKPRRLRTMNFRAWTETLGLVKKPWRDLGGEFVCVNVDDVTARRWCAASGEGRSFVFDTQPTSNSAQNFDSLRFIVSHLRDFQSGVEVGLFVIGVQVQTRHLQLNWRCDIISWDQTHKALNYVSHAEVENTCRSSCSCCHPAL